MTSGVNAAGWIIALTETITDTGQAPTSSSSQFTYTPDGLPRADTLPCSQGVVTATHQYNPDNRLTYLTTAGPPQSQVTVPRLWNVYGHAHQRRRRPLPVRRFGWC